jgi:hypothetical protein
MPLGLLREISVRDRRGAEKSDDICRAPTETPGDWNRMAASFLAHGAAAPEHLGRDHV